MAILPNHFASRKSGGGGVLPPWLVETVASLNALPMLFPAAQPAPPDAAHAGAPIRSWQGAPLPRARGSDDNSDALWSRLGGGLGDHSNMLLALAGGALRGGLGLGLSEAAKVGVGETELAHKRKAAHAQQAATVQALRALGLPDPAAIAGMNPYLARALLAQRSNL